MLPDSVLMALMYRISPALAPVAVPSSARTAASGRKRRDFDFVGQSAPITGVCVPVLLFLLFLVENHLF
jgi:hypothetical protein